MRVKEGAPEGSSQSVAASIPQSVHTRLRRAGFDAHIAGTPFAGGDQTWSSGGEQLHNQPAVARNTLRRDDEADLTLFFLLLVRGRPS
ncbi:hypothetical protein MRX96_019837 [Rhipicephalus microplus]